MHNTGEVQLGNIFQKSGNCALLWCSHLVTWGSATCSQVHSPFSFFLLDHPPYPGSNTAHGQHPETTLPSLRGAVLIGWIGHGLWEFGPHSQVKEICALLPSFSVVWSQMQQPVWMQRRKLGSQNCPAVSGLLASPLSLEKLACRLSPCTWA